MALFVKDTRMDKKAEIKSQITYRGYSIVLCLIDGNWWSTIYKDKQLVLSATIGFSLAETASILAQRDTDAMIIRQGS